MLHQIAEQRLPLAVPHRLQLHDRLIAQLANLAPMLGNLIRLIARLLADAGQGKESGQINMRDFVELADGLELLEIKLQRWSVDVIRGLRAVASHLQYKGDRSAPQPLAEDCFQFRLQSRNIVGQLDRTFKVSVVE